MGKDESSFYVIRRHDDAFDKAWSIAAHDPPKPDEGLWRDGKAAATYDGDDDWIKIRITPDPHTAQGYRSGQLFAFEITVKEQLAPIRITTQLRGETLASIPSLRANGSGSDKKGKGKEQPDADAQHRHQLPLDSPTIEMTYLGPGAKTLDDPVRNPFRQTYLVPQCGLCSCGQVRTLPSSCDREPIRVRYWFEITGHRLHTSETRLSWRGKSRLPDLDDKQRTQVLRIPIRIAAGGYAPRCILYNDTYPAPGLSQKEPPASVWQRSGECHSVRYFLEHERPSLSLGSSAGAAGGEESKSKALISSLAKDPPRSISASKSRSGFISKALGMELSMQAYSQPISPPKFNLVSAAPFVQVEHIGRLLRLDKHYLSTELRLVGPPGAKDSAQELFVKFAGDLVLTREDYGANVDENSAPQLVLPTRAQACNAEVRYDLVAELIKPTTVPSLTVCSVRATDVRIDLPASLASRFERQSRFESLRPQNTLDGLAFDTLSIAPPWQGGHNGSEVYDSRVALASGVYGSSGIPAPTTAPSEGTSRARAGAGTSDPFAVQLPPYEPRVRDERSPDEKSPGRATALPAASLNHPELPLYSAQDSPLSSTGLSATSTSQSTDPSASGGRLARMFSSFGRRSFSDSPAHRLVISSPVVPMPPSTTVARLPHQEAPPPSWEDAVRDDAIEDWVVASVALGTEDPPTPTDLALRSCSGP
ncbi:hypothetical protein JCM3774_005797 [Rhodotorula dairenensis]